MNDDWDGLEPFDSCNGWAEQRKKNMAIHVIRKVGAGVASIFLMIKAVILSTFMRL